MKHHATKAVLHALAAGATLRQGLTVAAHASKDLERTFLRAADDAEDDAFRSEALERIGLEPPIVGLVLGRARKADLKTAAALCLEAMSEEEPRPRGSFSSVWLLFTATTVIMVGLATFHSVSLLGAGRWTIAFAIALGVLGLVFAGVAIERTILTRWPLALRLLLMASLFFPPLFFVLFRLSPDRMLAPPLDARRIILWIAAGESAGMVPGAVIAALGRARRWMDFRLLLRMQVRVRGATNTKEAAGLLGRSSELPDAVGPMAGVELEGDSAISMARRLASMLELSAPRLRWETALGYVAAALIVIGAYLLASEVILAVARLGDIS